MVCHPLAPLPPLQVFLPEYCEGCVLLEAGPGDSVALPPGWLAAFTAVRATVAVGGHFLRADSIPVHLEACRVEVRPGSAAL